MPPTVFIASSVEGKALADALKLALDRDAWCKVWHESFPLSHDTLGTLLHNFAEHDFAVFVFSPDDTANMRQRHVAIARDNVLFEAGLFMGMHGARRTFVVVPRGMPDFHVPSDFSGFTTASYDVDHVRKDVRSGIGAVATEIRYAIQNHVTRSLDVTARATFVAPPATATWRLKLNLSVANNSDVAVAIETITFRSTVIPCLTPGLNGGPSAPAFAFRKDAKGNDLFRRSSVLEPGSSENLWVPVDESFGEAQLVDAVARGKCGTWHCYCTWLSFPPERQQKEFRL